MTAILPQTTITTAVAAGTIGGYVKLPAAPLKATVHANFIYGSGGTSVDAYLQTSFDGKKTWCDIAQFHFTTASARKAFNLSGLTPVTTQATPTDGSLAANTAIDGLLGDEFQLKWTSAGTYAGGTSLEIHIHADKK